MKKTTLILSLLLAVLVTATAQTTFTDAVKAYTRACPASLVDMKTNMEPALKQVNDALVEDYNGQQPDALLKRYMDTELMDGVTEYILVPLMEGNVTTAELQEVTKALLTPQGKLFQNHLTQVNTKMMPEVEKFVKDLAAYIREDKPLTPVTIRKDCPQSYIDLYARFWKASELENHINALMKIQVQTLGEDKKELLDLFYQYMSKNMQKLYVNCSYGLLTTSDLNFGIKTYSTPAYKHITGCMQKMADNPEMTKECGLLLVMSYLNWLTNQGVKLKDLE